MSDTSFAKVDSSLQGLLMEALHQHGDLIADRYQILGVLGQGGIGITYAAEELKTRQQVALKALSLKQLKDFKTLDLFKREARILQQLNHPSIPRYLDYFEVDQSRNRCFYIAQQLAEGESLANLMNQGWNPDEVIVQDIAVQILEILTYLQQLIPPVLHRDIKPQNIIRQENGRLVLVDFGAVQDTYHNTLTGGSTVVGTYGYMAPEQFRGQATLATDLYSLGATLLFLLTRIDPADLPQRKLKIDFRSYLQVSNTFATWLEHMLEPIAEERFQSATEALAVLRGEQAYNRLSYRASRRPTTSAITLKQNGAKLTVDIPPIGLKNLISRRFALLPIAANSMSLLLFLVLLVLTLGTLKGADLKAWLLLGGCAFCSLLTLWRFLLSAAVNIRLKFELETWYLERSFLGIRVQRLSGKTNQINEFNLKPISLELHHRQPVTTCVLKYRLKSFCFGTLLAEAEKAWLTKELQSFLQATIDIKP